MLISLATIKHIQNEGNVRENKTIPVSPVGVLGVEAHELVEEDVGNGGHAHRGTGVARVGLEGGIDREGTDGVDGQLVNFGVRHDGGWNC